MKQGVTPKKSRNLLMGTVLVLCNNRDKRKEAEMLDEGRMAGGQRDEF